LRVDKAYRKLATLVDETDGVAMEFKGEEGEWRFNLRSSNTESVVRLNVESVGNISFMKEKTKLILNLLRSER
jgi:phosphomannomutase